MNSRQFNALKERAQSFRGDDYRLRIIRINKIVKWIESNEQEIAEALRLDFNKPEFETQISEIMPCLTEAKFAIKNLKNWMSDQKVATPISLLGYRSHIRYENKGVVLIISPWNYPFQLAVVPLIAALASGNTAVIKPSELTPHTSALLKKFCENCFSGDEVLVELGGKEKTTELLGCSFDHVFFTGSTAVGRLIAETCGRKLIPVTLELGGKSPVIVDATCNLTETAEKIFWGNFLNRAQTCVAPDYILAHESIVPELVNKLKLLSDRSMKYDKGRIINDAHRTRLQGLSGQKSDLNIIPLEIVEIDNADHPLMQEEIFGPILPLIKYKDLNELQKFIKPDQKPLSMYIFSKSRKTIEFILRNFASGGVGINAVMVQFGNHHLPFGGIGTSGSGNYHGHFGFLEMSHKRAVIEQHSFSFLRRLLLPPYSPIKHHLLKWLKKI